MPTSPFKKLGGDQGGSEDLDDGTGIRMGRKGALRKGGSEEVAATALAMHVCRNPIELRQVVVLEVVAVTMAAKSTEVAALVLAVFPVAQGKESSM